MNRVSSVISKINIISKLLGYVYGDYWLKWQWAIIFKTIIPFVFWAMLYSWYLSIRNAITALGLDLLVPKPWAFITQAPYFIWLVVIILVIFFFMNSILSRYDVKYRKEMLNDLKIESKKLFEIEDKSKDLSKTMRITLIKVLGKYSLSFFLGVLRYMAFLGVPLLIFLSVGLFLGITIHLEVLLWVYNNIKDFAIFGFVPFSFVETAKDYLFHPYMAIIYVVLLLFLIGCVEAIGSQLERRQKRNPMYGFSTLLNSTNVLIRIANAGAQTLKCIFMEDVRKISQEIVILSRRDLQVALAKTIGKDQRVCTVVLHLEQLKELEEDEKEEIMKFTKGVLPKWLKKGTIGEIVNKMMVQKSKSISRQLEKREAHTIFALVREGCKFYALGQKIFGFSVKYSIWCEDPFLKEKIIELAGKNE